MKTEEAQADMYQSKTGVEWERQLHSWARPDDQWHEGGGSSDTKLGIKKLGIPSMEPWRHASLARCRQSPVDTPSMDDPKPSRTRIADCSSRLAAVCPDGIEYYPSSSGPGLFARRDKRLANVQTSPPTTLYIPFSFPPISNQSSFNSCWPE